MKWALRTKCAELMMENSFNAKKLTTRECLNYLKHYGIPTMEVASILNKTYSIDSLQRATESQNKLCNNLVFPEPSLRQIQQMQIKHAKWTNTTREPAPNNDDVTDQDDSNVEEDTNSSEVTIEESDCSDFPDLPNTEKNFRDILSFTWCLLRSQNTGCIEHTWSPDFSPHGPGDYVISEDLTRTICSTYPI
jgi:hypothetical protein